MRRLRHLLALGAVTAAAQAQPLFTQLDRRQLPDEAAVTYALGIGDLDGDGDPDLVVGNRDSRNRLLINQGGGRFEDPGPARLSANVAFTAAVALGDVDRDGDLDIVFGNGGDYREQSWLYLNDGRGSFTDATAGRLPLASQPTRAVALGDVDGDSDLDLVLGQAAGWRNRLLLNDGTGRFVDVTTSRLPEDYQQTYCLSLVDLDRDGDLDLVTAGQTTCSILVNVSGLFSDQSSSRLPSPPGTIYAVVARDLDADGDPDLVFASRGGQSRLYLNDGAGYFTDATATRFPVIRDDCLSLAAGDVDRDGDVDLWIGIGGLFARQDRLLLNDGTGRFADATSRVPGDGWVTAGLAMGDVDADGDLDVVQGNGGFQEPQVNRLFINDGGGTFRDASDGKSRLPGDVYLASHVVSADVDRDGDVDLVCADRGGQNRLYRNDGTGTFADVTATHLPAGWVLTMGAAAGDVDRDGDVDLVFAVGEQVGGQSRLCTNDGAGRYTDVSGSSLPALFLRSVAAGLGDVDGDGDLDIVLANYFRQNVLYLNDGRGVFTDVTAARLPVDMDDTRQVLFGDVDADGDLDLAIINGSLPHRLYLNDGLGRFTDATAGRLPVFGAVTSAAVLDDCDGDGDLDIAFACALNQQGRLFVNDGRGTFTDVTMTRMPPYADNAVSAAAADVDGDGDLDLLFGNTSPQPIRLLLNDGSGTFVDGSALVGAHYGTTTSLAAADFDADGDVDLALVPSWLPRHPASLLLNLLRQVDLPWPAVRGQPYRFLVFARHGQPRLRDLGAPFVAAARASIPLPPFGVIGIDPASLLALPPFVIPTHDGAGWVDVTVPNGASLLGLPLHVQALVVHDPRSAHLTNVVSDVVVR